MNRSVIVPGLLWCVLLLVAGLAPTTAWAQQDRRATVIEETIVTARRVEESLQDTPVSVSAFSSSDLEQMGASEAKDIASFTPNMSIRNQSSSQDNYNISIRGVSEGETSLAIDPTVGVYLDGIYIARTTGLAFDIVDMQRIEVLRGPQGTLFGRNTIGGAINVVTEKPSGEFNLRVKGGLGNRDYDTQQLTVDFPAFGNVAAKFSALRIDRDWPAKSLYTDGDLGSLNAEAYRLALRWSASDTLALDYSYEVTRRENNPELNQLSHVRPIYADPNGQFYGGNLYEQAAANASSKRKSVLPMRASSDDSATSDIDGHALIVEWDISQNLMIKSITSYREWESFTYETDFGSFPVLESGDVIDLRSGSASLVPVGTLVPLFSAQRLPSSQEQITQELQFIGSLFSDRLNYTAGLYYFEEETFEDNPQEFVLPTSLVADFAATGSGFPPELSAELAPFVSSGTASATWLNTPFLYTTDNSSYAIYGQTTWTVIPDFDITVGARYTRDKRKTTLRNNLDGGTEPTTVTASDSWSEFTPSLVLDYRWSEQINTYFKIATGYRSGGFNVRALTTSAFEDAFDPEILLAYELGIKSDLLNRRLRLNASLFRLEYTDRQISQFEAGTGGASSKIVNAGESVTHGIEIEATYIPFAGLRINAALGYLDVEFKEFISGPLDQETGFSTGDNRDISSDAATNLFAPEVNGSLAVEYQLIPWSFGQLTLRGDATYEDSYAFHPQFTRFTESPARTLFNARATLGDIPVGGDGKLKLALWGKNLTDKVHQDFGIDFGLLGFAIVNYANLRTYGLDVIYEFNR